MNLLLTVGSFIGVTILILSMFMYFVRPICPTHFRQFTDNSVQIEGHPSFPNMKAFEQWWESSEFKGCPMPVPVEKEREGEGEFEVPFTTTPINKADDYEFSRIFGYERGDRMIVPRQDYNLILTQRSFDWPDKPLSSDERQEKAKYLGIVEGFDATGEFVQRYGEKKVESDCHINREDREIAEMVANTYKSDADYEPVVTRLGANHWEVAELKPRRKMDSDESNADTIVDPNNQSVDIHYKYYDTDVDQKNLIDPYFPSGNAAWTSAANGVPGPIPGMERMFAPTFDHKDWIVGEQKRV